MYSVESKVVGKSMGGNPCKINLSVSLCFNNVFQYYVIPHSLVQLDYHMVAMLLCAV